MISLRARLEALAAGRPPVSDRAGELHPGFVDEHQAAFAAWERFCRIGGEALAAPAELLTPLP